MCSVYPLLTMKLFYIALFTIQLLNIDAVSEPMSAEDHEVRKADCNDSGVLAAVDFTLRKFNTEQRPGNKFALYRVIFAQTQVQEKFGLKYTVEFSIYETDCPFGSEKLWKDCNYNEPKIASSGKCNSETVINRIRRINEVISYNCTFSQDHDGIFHGKGPCLGCESPVQTDGPTLNKVSAHVTEEFNRNRTFTNYFRIATVHNLKQQVVSGIRYDMEFLNQETECSKDHPLLYEDVIACPFKANGTRLQCVSTVIEQGWINVTSASVTCKPEELKPVMLAYGGWGPFLLEAPQTENVREDSQSAGAEGSQSAGAPDSTEAHDISTCPGEPWKSLHHVKPALPPDNHQHESHENAEIPTDDAGLSASS